VTHDDDSPKLYVLVIEKSERLVDGYRYIKELIYNNMAIFMFNLYNKVIAAGIVPKGIKTDAILVTESKEELEKHFTFTPHVIGGLKFESGKVCVNKRVVQQFNAPFDIPQTNVQQFQIKDEWKYDEFQELFDDDNNDLKNNWFIGGDLPGVGKSHAVASYKYNNHNILFVPPYNNLAQETAEGKDLDAITGNMLLGIYGDGKEYVKMKQYNVNKYDCICFDEILLNNPQKLHKIDLFMKSHPRIKFFATGDVDQLQPIEFNFNNVNRQEYMMKCINHMFPNQIMLTIPKRVKTEDERETLRQLKKDIFDKSKDVIQTLQAHGFKMITRLDQLRSTKNISYFRYRTNLVNSYVHKNLIKTENATVCINNVNYWRGLVLVCKKHYKNKEDKLFTNKKYTIITISKNKFSIFDSFTKKILSFDIAMLSHFQLPYSNTCHSVQGLSIDGPITIFDVNSAYVDRYYVWTALTRATNLNNVTIFKHSDYAVCASEKAKQKQYFVEKVKGYKHQDNMSGRVYDENSFITADWINETFENLESHVCSVCREPYEIYTFNGEVHSNLTVDRIDSSLAHTKDNVRLCCKTCNATKSNHY
ncbi:MAG TPA: hypothetical protein PLS50_06530, partial [Candidatus Dojkabacteria bacterium]|nr:hypothetical protein [Candidatus Dojkabacteria bacterium]